MSKQNIPKQAVIIKDDSDYRGGLLQPKEDWLRAAEKMTAIMGLIRKMTSRIMPLQ